MMDNMSSGQNDTQSLPTAADSAFSSVQHRGLASFARSPTFLSLVIAAVTLITFARVLTADFVMWDDDRMIYYNPNLQGLSLERLSWIFTHVDVTRRYTPLAALNYTITYQFCKLNPLGYHLSTWLFHAASAVLVFLVLRKLLMFGPYKIKATAWRITISSAIAAMLWSVHPLRVETVAWAGANFYCQALFFLLASLLFYLRANEADITAASHYRRLAASVGLFVLSLLSHPIGIGYFVVPLVLDVYPLRRLRGNSRWWTSAATRRVLLEKLPFVAVALIVASMTVVIRLTNPSAISQATSLAEFGLLSRIMQAMYIWAYYAWRPWYPVNLAPVYSTFVNFNPLSLPFIASAAGTVGVTAALIALRRRWPLALALVICHLALLVPVLGLTYRPHYHVDRYSMIVSICWSVLLAWWLARSKIKTPIRSVVLVVSIVSVAALSVLSFRQTRVWNNSITLFKHMIKNLGDDPYRQDIYWRLGLFYTKQHKIPQAVEQFQMTLQINQNHPLAHLYLAQISARQGKINEAVIHYNKVLTLNRNNLVAMNNLAWLLAVYKTAEFYDPQEAVRLAERACERTGYRHPLTMNTLATAYAASGRFTEAVDTAEKALKSAELLKQKAQAKEIQNLLRLYKAGKPYIKPSPKVSSP